MSKRCGTTADRKSTRLNSSHLVTSYAASCLKKNKDGASPLTADADALGEAQQREDDGRGDPDGRGRRQHPDEERGGPHQQEGRDEGGLATDAVSHVAEDRRADGPGREADEE